MKNPGSRQSFARAELYSVRVVLFDAPVANWRERGRQDYEKSWFKTVFRSRRIVFGACCLFDAPVANRRERGNSTPQFLQNFAVSSFENYIFYNSYLCF
jgi:hypothetical protein